MIATGGLAELIAPHTATIEPRRPVPDARGPAAGLGAQRVIVAPDRPAFFAVAALALLARARAGGALRRHALDPPGAARGLVSVPGSTRDARAHHGRHAGLSALLVSSAPHSRREVRRRRLPDRARVWTLLSRTRDADIALGGERTRRAFAQGVVVNVLNPKTALFFLAFLPQFVDPNAPIRRCRRLARHPLRHPRAWSRTRCGRSWPALPAECCGARGASRGRSGTSRAAVSSASASGRVRRLGPREGVGEITDPVIYPGPAFGPFCFCGSEPKS